MDKLSEIEAMRMGTEYSFPVQLRKFSINLRPISNAETMQCYGDVADYINSLSPSRRTKIEEDNALAREFLKKASSPSDQPNAPRLTDPILSAMTNDEMMYLYKEWQATCDRVNPSLEKMPIDKLKELVEDIKKNPPEDLVYQLTELSFGQLVNLATYLLTKSD